MDMGGSEAKDVDDGTMFLRVLFLDDDEQRTRRFRSRCPGCTITATSAECIAALERGRFDLVYLDHDLGGEVFVDSGREDCGMEVVRWIVDNEPEIRKIVVHTHNGPAGAEMVAKLCDAGYAAAWKPFSTLF